MYVTLTSRISSIIGLIEPELSELFALEFAKIAESDFVYTLASINVDQLVPNLVIIYMTMRSRMSSIMGQIRLTSGVISPWIRKNCLILLCLHSTSTNNNQSPPNLVKMYVTVRSWESTIMNLIGTEWSELSALYLRNCYI